MILENCTSFKENNLGSRGRSIIYQKNSRTTEGEQNAETTRHTSKSSRWVQYDRFVYNTNIAYTAAMIEFLWPTQQAILEYSINIWKPTLVNRHVSISCLKQYHERYMVHVKTITNWNNTIGIQLKKNQIRKYTVPSQSSWNICCFPLIYCKKRKIQKRLST